MLARNSFLYVFARGGPGLINFLAIVIYTRLLSSEQYGKYTLVISGIGLVELVGFKWLGLCIARFLPAHSDKPEMLLSVIKSLFLVLALSFSVVGLVASFLWPDPAWQRLIAISVPLLVISAWFEINLLHAAAKLSPGLYGRINLTKSTVALAIGALLAWLGLGSFSPLWGLLIGMSLSTLVFGGRLWRNIKIKRPDTEKVKMMLAYGIPVVANFALAWVVTSSDRFLLGWLIDLGAAGRYAVGYDLAHHSIGMLLMMVNLAAYPLAIHVFEKSGSEAARNQMLKNGIVIFSLAISAAAGIAVLAPLIGSLVLGAEYRNTAIELLPWVALAAALSGVKAYYFDVAFHLGGGMSRLVWISVGAALLNLGFNLALIPPYGILGAAYATVLSYLFGTIASALLGRRFFILPDIIPIVYPALLVATSSSIAAWIAMQYDGWTGLVLGLLAGSSAALLCAIGINLAGIRARVLYWLKLK